MCQKTTKHKIITFSAWIAAHITLVVVLVTIGALFFPSSFAWMSTSSITPMLGVVMFGMGLTLTPSDFNPVLQHIGFARRACPWSNPRRMLSGRYGKQCHLLSGKGRCRSECCHDRSLHIIGSHCHTSPCMVACRKVSRSRHYRYVFKYRSSSDNAHRTWFCRQSLFQTDHSTYSSVAAYVFHPVHCFHHRDHCGTQLRQHPRV